jgi:hypothetical protein
MFFKSKLIKYLAVILLIGVISFILFRSASRKEGFDASEALKTRTDAIAKFTKDLEDATVKLNNAIPRSCGNRKECPGPFDYVKSLELDVDLKTNELKRLKEGDRNSNTEEGKLSLDQLKAEDAKAKASIQTQELDKIPDFERRLSALESVITPKTITQT